jgi:hypothetical protein
MTMTMTEVGELLGDCAAFDLRTVGPSDVLAWHKVVGHLEAREARAAVVRHYTDTSERIMPRDVLRLVAAARQTRTTTTAGTTGAAIEADIPDADPNDVRAYLAALRENRTRQADPDAKRRPVAQLLAGVFGKVPSETPEAAARRRADWADYFDGFKSDAQRNRALVFAHADLTSALTGPPLGYTDPNQWNGYIPAATDSNGRLNTSPHRAALVALVGEAMRRERAERQAQPDSADQITPPWRKP